MIKPRVQLCFGFLLGAVAVGADEPRGTSGAIERSIVIPYSAFNESNLQDNGYSSTDTGGYVKQVGSGMTHLQAPIVLPVPGLISGLEAYVYDNTDFGNLNIQLKKRDFSIFGAATDLVNLSTNGYLSEDVVINLFRTSVSNGFYGEESAYYLSVTFSSVNDFGGDLRLYAVKLDYIPCCQQIFVANMETGDLSEWTESSP